MGVDGHHTTTAVASALHSNRHIKQENGIGKQPNVTNHLMDLLSFLPDDQFSAPPKSAGDALLNLLGASSTTRSNSITSPAHHSAGGTDMLLDLLSLGGPAVPPTSTMSTPPLAGLFDADSFAKSSWSGVPLNGGQPSKSAPAALDPFISAPVPGFPSITALQTSALKVTFDFTKPPGSPQTTVIKASYSNLSSNPFTDFVFQAAVPKFMQLQLEPATSSTLPASGCSSITQVIRLTNSMHEQKALVLKLRVSYKANGQNVLEQGQVSNFLQACSERDNLQSSYMTPVNRVS